MKERIFKNEKLFIYGRVNEFPQRKKVVEMITAKKTVDGYLEVTCKTNDLNSMKMFILYDEHPIGYMMPKNYSNEFLKMIQEEKKLKVRLTHLGNDNGREVLIGNLNFENVDVDDKSINTLVIDEEANLIAQEEKPQSSVDKIISKGIEVGMSEEDARKRIDLLVFSYSLSMKEIEMISNFWSKPDEEVKDYIPSLDKVIYQDDEERHFYRVLGHMAVDGIKALRLVGSMSTGKNVFIESLASLLYKPLLEVDMQRNTEAEDFEGRDTLGYKRFVRSHEDIDKMMSDSYRLSMDFMNFNVNINDPYGTLPPAKRCDCKISELNADSIYNSAVRFMSEGNNQIVQTIDFIKQPLTLAMQHGCWVNFNELNFAQAHVLARLHRVLDTRESIYIPSLGEIKAKNGFAFMSTMNPPKGGYVGTGYMNEAFETRLMTIYLNPTKSIRAILDRKYPGHTNDVRILNSIYEQVYNSYKTGNLTEGFLALRRYEAALTQKGFGDLRMSIEDHLMNISCNDEDARQKMADIIDAVMPK